MTDGKKRNGKKAAPSPLPTIVANLFVPAGVVTGGASSGGSQVAASSPVPESSDHHYTAERVWTPTANAIEDEDDEQRLWCVCQSVYQDGVLMVCCDKCNAWFHPECVGVPIDKANYLQAFFCPDCQSDTRQTSFFEPCARADCQQPAGGGKRYCSVQCGLYTAQKLLKQAQLNKAQLAGLKDHLKGAKMPDGFVEGARNEGVLASRLQGQISTLQDQIAKLNETLVMAEARIRYTHANLEYDQKASNGLCNFDLDSVVQDQDFHAWVASKKSLDPLRPCQEVKKCRKHADWRKSKLLSWQGLATRTKNDITAKQESIQDYTDALQDLTTATPAAQAQNT